MRARMWGHWRRDQWGTRAWLGTISGVLIVLALVLSGCGQLPISGLALGLPTPPARPTATPLSADVETAPGLAPSRHNAAVGCAPKAPKPYPLAIGGGTYHNAPVPNEVALTFDDGPVDATTIPIMNELTRTHTPATFFVQGLYAHAFPNIVKQEWANPLFAIGAHTWDHPNMTLQTDAQLKHQFGDTLAELHSILGPGACIWLWRPPYGAWNAHVLAVAATYGLTTVTWDDAGSDWLGGNGQQIAANAIQGLHPGADILLHDGIGNSTQTLLAVPTILAALKARGLKPVTLPQLLADCHFPGVSVVGPPAVPASWPTPAAAPAG